MKRNSHGGPRKGAGRPTDNPRSATLNIRLPADFLDRCRTKAEAMRLTLTAWVERALEKQL